VKDQRMEGKLKRGREGAPPAPMVMTVSERDNRYECTCTSAGA